MKTRKTGPPRRNRHRQLWFSHERYRENGTNRWGNLTGTFRFRVRAARRTCRGAHKVTTRKTGEEERRQENQSLDSPYKSGAGDASRRFKRPGAVVKSFNWCCQCQRILSGSNDPSMLVNVKAITFSNYEHCSEEQERPAKPLSSGIAGVVPFCALTYRNQHR